jgi:hypothetical protein
MSVQQPLEKSVFLQAIEITSDTERTAYLDEACKSNPQLRGEVEALLCAHETTQGAGGGFRRPAQSRG